MRSFAALVLGLLAAAPSSAGEPEAFVSKEGGFSARFPGKPKEETKAVKSATGDLTVRTTSFGLPDGMVLSVTVIDYPAEAIKGVSPDALLARARDGLKGKKGDLLEDRDDPFGPEKWPSRTARVSRGKHEVAARLVLRDSRLYQAMAVGSKEQVSGAAAATFLASLELSK